MAPHWHAFSQILQVLQNLAELCDLFKAPREDDTGKKKGRTVFFESAVHKPAGGDIAGRFGREIGQNAREQLGRKGAEDVRLP